MYRGELLLGSRRDEGPRLALRAGSRHRYLRAARRQLEIAPFAYLPLTQREIYIVALKLTC
jgi:hypothetical protein